MKRQDIRTEFDSLNRNNLSAQTVLGRCLGKSDSGLQPAFVEHFQDTRRTLIFHLVHLRDTPITVTLHTFFTWALSIHTWVFPGTHVQ